MLIFVPSSKKHKAINEQMQKGSLLYDLYSIHAMTGREWPMVAFIREYVSKHIPEAEILMDKLGNLYITKCKSDKG